MRFLDALVDSKPARFTLEDYSQWLNGSFSFNGSHFPLGLNQTLPGSKTEPIGDNFQGFVDRGLRGSGVVWTLELVRVQVFSQARFLYRRFRNGRPGDLFPQRDLSILERPWAGATTGDLLARMILDADAAGNFYGVESDGEVVRLRPDWVDIVLEERTEIRGQLGFRKVGYLYWPDGRRGGTPTVLLPEEVVHFAPQPDPLADYRGMSWMTPVVREVMADQSATVHKLKFFDNAATPNIAVSLPKEITPEQFEEFVEKMDEKHKGAANAYKTLYTAGGADVTVVGADMRQLDFKATQGAGETRLAAAAGVGAIIAQFSEGMQGSSLNAGNYAAARRRFSDITMRHLWQNAAGSLEVLVNPPGDAQLWYDDADIPFLQEDRKDAVDIESVKASTANTLITAGFDANTVIDAVSSEDLTLLKDAHSGLFSIQLQPPGSGETNSVDMTVTASRLVKLLNDGWTVVRAQEPE